MAVGIGARAEVYPINLTGGRVAEDDAAARVVLFRFGGDGGHPNLALAFAQKDMPAALVGNPSALAEAIAEAPGAGVSPYDVFGEVISIPGGAALSAPSYFLATRRSRFANTIWAINDFFESFDFFGPPAGFRAAPLAAGAAQAMRTSVSKLTRSLPSEPASSAPPSPSGDDVWNNWGCLWSRSVSDPWKQPSSGPC